MRSQQGAAARSARFLTELGIVATARRAYPLIQIVFARIVRRWREFLPMWIAHAMEEPP
jgi:hypothetical protein